MMVMTLLPIVAVAAYALSSMLSAIAIEDDINMIKEAVKDVHNLGDIVHYIAVRM